jgi:hypothetical protein
MQDPPDEAQSQAKGLSQSLSAQFGRSRATVGDCTYDTRVDNPHNLWTLISLEMMCLFMVGGRP